MALLTAASLTHNPVAARTLPFAHDYRSSTTAATFMQSNNAPFVFTSISNVLVLSWENVLAPMTWLSQQIGLRATHHSMEVAKTLFAQNLYLQRALATIEEQVIELLRIAASIGPVYIITQKSMAYMEATCAAFFPHLAHWLATVNAPFGPSTLFRVDVIAPPKKFTSPMESAVWRVDVFQSIWRSHTQQLQHNMPHFSATTGSLSLITFGASTMDTLACLKAIESASHLVPKCVQVRGTGEQPLSLEEFSAQLQMLHQYVVAVVAHDSAFSVQL